MKDRIKSVSTRVIILVVISLAAAAQVSAEGVTPTASFDAGLFNQYVWRGWGLSDGGPVFQPSAMVAYRGVSVNLWGNLDMNAPGDASPNDYLWNETDFTVGYDGRFGIVNASAGYIYYALDGMADSQEIYFGFGLDVLLSPTVTAYREIAYLPGWYGTFGISHSFGLTEGGIALDLAGSIAYLSVDDGDDFLHDGTVSAGLSIPFGEYFTFCPMIAYAFPLSDEAEEALEAGSLDGEKDHFFGGATLSMGF